MAEQKTIETPEILSPVSEPAELVKYQPLAPIGDQKTLKGLLERNLAAIKQILPRHVPAERLVKTLLMAVSRQPDLLECTQESILEGVMRSAELGLDLSGTTGEAYLVPFNTKIKIPDNSSKGYSEQWRKLATFIPGYRGLAKLARQSGEVGRIEAEPVYEADKFTFKKGINCVLEFEPAVMVPDRGRCLGYYALVMNRDDTQPIVMEFMSLGQVKAVQAKAKSGNSPAWRDHFDEMGRKTAFRRAAKWAPLSGERFQQAVAVDNSDFDLDSFEVIETTATATAPTAEEIKGKAKAEAPLSPAQAYLEAEVKKGLPEQVATDALLSYDAIEPGQTWKDLGADVTIEVVKDALSNPDE